MDGAKIVLKVSPGDLERCVPSAGVLAQAASRGMEVLVRRHLRKRDATASHKPGFPSSGYWLDAADATTSRAEGATAIVEVDKEGVALHYEGGTVRPKKKALAIPIDPAVAGTWPSEANGVSTGGADDEPYALIWPKGSSHGFIKDTETGDLLWMLVPKATIKADATVLPTDAEIFKAAEDAVGEAFQ